MSRDDKSVTNSDEGDTTHLCCSIGNMIRSLFWLLFLASCCIHLAACGAAEEQGSEGIPQQV